MNIEEIREFCLSMKGVSEDFPFDETTLVFKVLGKMFCLANLEGDLRINIKNTPEKIIALREEYQAVSPGYHMNKKHWNTVRIDGTIKKEIIQEWIVESYNLVIKGMPKKIVEKLNML